MTGAMVSWRVIVCMAPALLPQRSVAVHVRVMIAGQAPLVLAVNTTTTFVSQLSVATTAAGAGTSFKHWTATFVGTPTSCGGVVSFTVMTCVHVPTFPHASVAL